jgi:hypothetical protein
MKTAHTPDTLTQASLVKLAAFKGRPCLSLYQPTHRRHPENQQDPIRFGHLVKALETSLPQELATEAKKVLLAPFHALADDRDFWNHTQDGLAVLSAAGLFRVFRLQQPVAELAVVADSFHTKPLRQRLQSIGRYQVLALSLHKVRLFEGDRHALDPQALTPDDLRRRVLETWQRCSSGLGKLRGAMQVSWPRAFGIDPSPSFPFVAGASHTASFSNPIGKPT